MFPLANPTKVSTAAHSMCFLNCFQFQLGSPLILVTAPEVVAHRVSANSERCGYTPTSSKMSLRGAVGAFSLCILFYLSTICPSGPPWNKGHRPNGSSRDQRF